MSRRNARNSRRVQTSVASAGPASIGGLQGWDAVSLLVTGLGTGLLGSTSGDWMAWLGRLDARTTNVTRFLPNNITAGTTNGCRFIALGTNDTVDFRATFTGGTAVTPTKALTNAEIGKLAIWVGVYDQPNARVRLYCNAVEVGNADVSGLGTRTPSAGRTAVGNRADTAGSPAVEWSIFGLMGGDGFVPTQVELAAQLASTQATGVFASIAGKTTLGWRFPTTWNPPSTISPFVGSEPLAMDSGTAADLALATATPPHSWI